MRYKAVVEYEGTSFIGWQRQHGVVGKSVQESIERSIKEFCQQSVIVYAAGRTDAGVHATGQVVHFDLKVSREDYVIKNALNHYLRNEKVSILQLERVDEEFHARFSAKKRHYTYKISNREAPLCIDLMRMWHVPKRLNVENMREAASYIVGKHDFASFRAKDCQSKSSIKTVDSIDIIAAEEEININISAQSFLHKQVRITVGTFVECGMGLYPPAHVLEILEKKDRAAAGITAPAHGLYLTRVDY
ncbi:tRNA pseudouridine(38-40) synthase TruA [Anaplasma phagocytophilum]|uniref:tRNA pseudouridine synthase A n=3 Tax=Anaplasma phagocytophilum TaxID=948 RepID=TRUA_ANAPZ|nr:tRNA pseudouridine(38-40) synthase TruA [Anaplasma phagocytophilum]Q2GKK4.1 RecName: Full=tRNA pseudouridine synthase A; AltName: Full=tRNA pseudouridine(38-40) synthase; AltName: Full=tRNA pseudouridylate synthase I; AltName: Full=tRNA-uridine isomerase I [Anaplasma phagocytophilum str. HZ]KKA00898.1 tRNA pseudouridine(38-40) synthase [Anaplasma phagocytophilum str. CR1007]ABD44026.1 tRNA pseudouridine synthase A [Anaplasma phagocytophilum str. HZ]AGR78820.1 tRNA pseudouridine synthase A [A